MGQARKFDPDERLDSAVDAFWQHGFDGSGMQALCKAMGLFPGSLYGTYGDKRQLFLQAIDRYMTTVSTDAIETLGAGGSGLAALRLFFARLIDGMVDGKRRWGCLVTNSIVELAPRDPEIARRVELHLARLETAFAAAIVRARAAGELPATATPDVAGFLVCVVQGMNVLAKTRPPRARLALMAETALAALGAAPTEIPR
jgi:TetR/AcrR family transcriptional repressor of nem operon